MRLKGISIVEAGNEYLKEYIEEQNRLFAVTANKPEEGHRPVKAEDLERASCYKEKRQLSKNLEIKLVRQDFTDSGAGSELCPKGRQSDLRGESTRANQNRVSKQSS